MEGGRKLRPIGADSFSRQCNVPDEAWLGNIEQNIKRGTPQFAPAIVHNAGEIVIVGSGPSVADHIDDIRDYAARDVPIIAVKGAHDWLIEREVVPNLSVCMDAQAKIIECVRHRNERVCYLLASQVHPDVYDWLSGHSIVMWHAWAGSGEAEVLGPDRLLVGGGSTSGLRAMSLSYLMGFRRFVMFGFDSCLKGNVKRVNGDIADNLMDVRVGPAGEAFTCNGAMAAQAAEFQSNFQMMPGIKVRIVGGGLLAAIMAERQRLGFDDSF